MASSSPFRRLLHLPLIAALIAPGSASSMHVDEAAAATTAEAPAMPCHGGDMAAVPEPVAEPPCDDGCCPEPNCDVSLCLSTALVPAMTTLPASLPGSTITFAWTVAGLPSDATGTLLRPPIA